MAFLTRLDNNWQSRPASQHTEMAGWMIATISASGWIAQLRDHLAQLQVERAFPAQIHGDAAAHAAAREIDEIIDQRGHPADAAPHAHQDLQHGVVPGFQAEQIHAILQGVERGTQVMAQNGDELLA